MKIPYIKIYTADLLAKTRRLSPQEIGEAVIAACEMAFEGSTDYKPAQANAQAFFNMLNDWTSESKDALKAQHSRAKKGAQARWQKSEVLDGAQAFTKEMPKQSICQCQTETETETETDINKQHTASLAAGQLKPNPKLNKLQNFSNAVLAEFENLETKDQIAVWFKRNCRCLTDILRFCGGDIKTAVETIRVCVERLEKAGLTGGYEAVCRNLPEYYQAAKKRLNGGVYAK